MGKQGKNGIAWTDQTWNPITGCSKVSQGCKNCYAESMAKRFWKGRKFTDVRCHEDRLEYPRQWKKPMMIFVNSMSDMWHEDVPFEFIDRIYDEMIRDNWHTYQILTKRPERANEWADRKKIRFPFGIPKHIWIGVSVENQNCLWRIHSLKRIHASVRFVSFEPLLENIGEPDLSRIDWAIVGGESGHHARSMNPEWAISILRACRKSKAAFFMKQLSQWHNSSYSQFDSFPKSLQVREYPTER